MKQPLSSDNNPPNSSSAAPASPQCSVHRSLWPVRQLVLAVYFLPFLVALFCMQPSAKGSLGIAVSICALSTCALTLFFTVKKWELEKKASLDKLMTQETKERIDQLTSASTSKDELITSLQAAQQSLLEELNVTKKTLSDLSLIHKQTRESEHELSQLRESALEKGLTIQIQEKTLAEQASSIQQLTQEVERLQFEMKTLVKLLPS